MGSVFGRDTPIPRSVTEGESWIYYAEADGIAFQLREGKVVSWQLF